ncbi:ATP-dependent DNA ligase [Catellatospora sp. KI3]|uniref:ATP-dependent DNA ligase n=1 Tax=Catellatospora sp. KI3 TaxID=3041620 RepID=UPI002482E2E6|nr:ATP-dependent DNA ligase [Catellatospora sp. KI3]MDI1465013.1 ATP-dependent DNA ligase [Catellatospora sp. KI3]
MELPVLPPLEPMLAKPVSKLPDEPGMTFEPKWDGYRCIIFRDGDEVELASRGGKSLTRYFPEVVELVKKQFPVRSVIDCEIVVIRREEGQLPRLNFDLLGQRIHPAASRVKKLSVETPADVIAFDLLALDDRLLMDEPYSVRRALLADALKGVTPPVHLTPVTTDAGTAREWFTAFEGAGLDGLIAKPADMAYVPGKRLMFKIKHARTADVVVAGFRYHTSGPIVGSLLLGLYDDEGTLHHVGVSSSFTAARRKELLDELEPYRDPAEHPWAVAGEGQRVPGAPSRWSGTKDLSFEPLRPELVVEVGYDAMEGDRFRHTAQFQRWRPDRTPQSCRYDQLDRPISLNVDEVLATP